VVGRPGLIEEVPRTDGAELGADDSPPSAVEPGGEERPVRGAELGTERGPGRGVELSGDDRPAEAASGSVYEAGGRAVL
jgi:hypothetical protein